MTAPEHQMPAAIYVAFAGDHIRKWSREPFEGSTAFHAAEPGAEALRAALAKVLPSGDDRAPGDRIIPFYIRMDELRALRDLVSFAAPPAEDITDKDRLDFLDRCNLRLNERYGTNYRWELILNHNVTRLMLGGLLVVDLNDSAALGLASCRAAIDARIHEARAARVAPQPQGEGDGRR